MYHRLAPTHSNAPALVFYGIIDMLQFKSRSFKNRKESIPSVPQMATPELHHGEGGDRGEGLLRAVMRMSPPSTVF